MVRVLFTSYSRLMRHFSVVTIATWLWHVINEMGRVSKKTRHLAMRKKKRLRYQHLLRLNLPLNLKLILNKQIISLIV